MVKDASPPFEDLPRRYSMTTVATAFLVLFCAFGFVISHVLDQARTENLAHELIDRQAQIMAKNPTLKCVNFRGNVQTRLRKLDDGVVDATLLAIAGLKRMDMDACATSVLDWEEMLPAVSQGAIGIQCRSDDERSLKYIDALNHPDTKACVDDLRRVWIANVPFWRHWMVTARPPSPDRPGSWTGK